MRRVTVLAAVVLACSSCVLPLPRPSEAKPTTTTSPSTIRTTGVKVAAVTDAVAVTAGEHHSCALAKAGTVTCWGDNREGQLGDGTTVDSPRPVQVVGLTDAVSVDASRTQTCAVRKSGTVVCWGQPARAISASSRLGLSGVNGVIAIWGIGAADPTRPSPVSGVTDAVAVASTAGTSCALSTAGTVACWSRVVPKYVLDDDGIPIIKDGQFVPTDPTVGPRPPGPIDGVRDAVALTAGDDFVCALLKNRTVMCWGDDEDGELGTGPAPTTTTIPSGASVTGRFWSTATVVVGVDDAVSISAGRWHVCAVSASGTVSCWGNDQSRQLGDGRRNATSTPVRVGGVSDAVSVAGGRDHTCALLRRGTVTCWGKDHHGELGDGTTNSSGHAVTAEGVSDAVAVSAEEHNSCALLKTGTVTCWGDDEKGQLGNG